MKKILFIIFFELIIKCVRKKYSIMFIDMLHRLKNKYVHTCKINDKFPYLDMSCDDQFKRNCPVKHTLLVVAVTVLQLCIYYNILPMILKQQKTK